jgi:hypothetical protein
MPADTKAMGLLIRMVPLMRREFGRSIDTNFFFGDSTYAASILGEALEAQEPRLVTYARELRFRIEEITRGPVSGVRSSSRSTDSHKTTGSSSARASTLNSADVQSRHSKFSHTLSPSSKLPEPTASKLPGNSLFGNSELPDKLAKPKSYVKGVR